MERTNLQYVGFVRVLSTSQGPTIVKDVPIKKASARCVARRSWIRRTTSKHLSNCTD
ncbi:hypothetical protein DV515_00004093 [Chloebia gouldiae]|uniref:Uncharacterized protein n=1 Tax=Chloebia gouldiae TaxID=44316 RepID=A0A3L8SSK8_CHLGU|nr:hypothetical protein DV515_00004093 [Chloebia gouldiae]